MYKFDEQALRKGINMGLGSQGIWTPELEGVMFNEITNESLRIHDVSGQVCGCCKKQLTAGAFPKWFCLRDDCKMYLKPQTLR